MQKSKQGTSITIVVYFSSSCFGVCVLMSIVAEEMMCARSNHDDDAIYAVVLIFMLVV
tara:strand:- start:1323 stop:1496 length:174 start_codon:yes stop_codon:yes gene_type:complete